MRKCPAHLLQVHVVLHVHDVPVFSRLQLFPQLHTVLQLLLVLADHRLIVFLTHKHAKKLIKTNYKKNIT